MHVASQLLALESGQMTIATQGHLQGPAKPQQATA